MIIQNNTSHDIITDTLCTIKPEDSHTFYEHIFDTLNIHSDIGSIILICEYGDRHVREFGSLKAIIDKDDNVIKIVERKVCDNGREKETT